MNTFLLCIFALTSVALCGLTERVEDDHKPVIDLHQIVTGFNVPEPKQTQRYWLDSRTIVIDLAAFYVRNEADGYFPPDFLWEFNLHADHAIGGINACEYSLGYLSLGEETKELIEQDVDLNLRLDDLADLLPRHTIKTGGFGAHRIAYGPQYEPWTWEKQNEGSFWHRSSSVVFLRGADPMLNRRQATHLYLEVDSCYLSRYVIHSQFERWNGGAYLMDWGNTPLESSWEQSISDAAAPRLVRWESFDLSSQSAEDSFINKFNFLERDSTIFGDSQGWWHESFYFDYSQFSSVTGPTITTPILDFWYYSGEDDVDEVFHFSESTYFRMCSSNTAATIIQCETSASTAYTKNPFAAGDPLEETGAAIWSSSTSGQSLFVRAYLNINELETYLYGATTPLFQTILIHGGVKAAIPPYARMWDANTNRANAPTFAGAGPGLMSLQNTQTSGCNQDGLRSQLSLPPTPRSSTFYLFSGWNVYRCQSNPTGKVTIDFSIPSWVASWPNPWMQWYEWGEDDGGVNAGDEYAYTIVDGNVGNAGFNNKVLHVSEYDHDPNLNNEQPYEFQVPLPQTIPRREDWRVISGQSLHVDITSGRAAFSSWVPIYPGVPNMCIGNPCDDGPDKKAMCSNWYRSTVGYYCMCSSGWMGDKCEVSVDDCYRGACLNGGVCVEANDDAHLHKHTCDCSLTQYTGDFCERLLNNCPVAKADRAGIAIGDPHGVCLNGGACVSIPSEDGNGWKCECTGTWSGQFCETSTNDCRSDPIRGANGCGEHGTCTDLDTVADGVYTCDCDAGYQLDVWCQVHDVCFGTNNPCKNGGMCIAVDAFSIAPGTLQPIVGQQDGVLDTARCLCAGLWFGETCEETFEEYADDCRPTRSGKACERGVCGPVPGASAGDAWACDCPDGYHGQWCEIAAQCEGDANPCNTMDMSAECRWMPTQPEAPSAGLPDQRGIFGEHMCICSASWFGPLCTESLENYFDDCRFWDEPCNGGKCLPRTRDGEMVYECDCTDVPFDGEFCEAPLACRGEPCGPNGTCSVEKEADGSYSRHCQCFGGFVGASCEFELEEWISDKFDEYTADCRFSELVCLNGGTCRVTTGGFACICVPPYSGTTCAVANVCDPNPCEGGGVCDVYNGQASCLCTGGRIGARCEQSLREFFTYDCRLSGCMNGGQCSMSTRACNCPAAFLPPLCEKPAVCAANPCLNGGICQLGEGETDRSCLCPGSFFGPNCEWNVSFELADCRTQTCGENGECDLFNGEYVCICSPGWEGDLCEISPHCNPQPCKNGGRCYEYAASFACHCAGEWSGDDCAISISTRLEDIEEQLEADVAGQVAGQVSSSVDGDISDLQAEFTESQTAIEQLNTDLVALREQLNVVSTSSKSSSDAINELKNQFCTEEEADQIRIALELFLSPANNIVMSLGLFLAVVAYFFN